MGNIATFSIDRPLYTWMLMLACVFGGWWGINTVGRLEDPAFPIKQAYIITSYPGASAVEVEQEITDTIEASLQELPYLDHLVSKSVPGRSEIQIEIIESISGEEIRQIWDEVRRRVAEAGARLPPGAGTPHVEDDFGDVYGILYAVTIEGYAPDVIADVARDMGNSLTRLDGVAKVASAGEPREGLFVEIANEKLVRLGLPLDALLASVGAENQVVGAGSEIHGGRRLRIAPDLAFDSVEAVSDMRIGKPGSTEIFRLGDIATISRQPLEDQFHIIRHNGVPAITIGVSVMADRNVVEVGERVDAAIQELAANLPLGMEIIPIYQQHVAVRDSINTFLLNLAASVFTVFAALFVFMGWRAGIVVGAVLLFTVLGTLCVMALCNIELQRISLGALMIAMGMLVDNAIVIAEGMVVGVALGRSPAEAAAQSVHRTQFPLLGATLIGIMAFAPIGLSDDNSGYFLRALFQVVAISLLLSWILAITVVPLLGKYLLVDKRASTEPGNQASIYQGWSHVPYRALLSFGLRRAWTTTFIIVGITLACLWAVQFMKPGFFPTTNTPLFYVDVQLPQGADILTTQNLIADMEGTIRADAGVIAVSSFIGRGASRFTATFRPEQPNPAYTQLVVRVADVTQMPAIMSRLSQVFAAAATPADIQFYRMEFSPSGNSKIEARFSGSDPAVLRQLADQTLAVYLQHNLVDRKVNWRQPTLDLVPEFDTVQARRAGISRQDVYSTLAYATSGVSIGLFRDHEKLVPIVARAPQRERGDITRLGERLVWSTAQQQFVPMSQVIRKFEVRPSDDLIWRRDRVRTINVLANPQPGLNATYVFNALRTDIESIKLPHGYHLEWGGEHEGSEMANRLLLQKIPMTFGSMLLITILMFGQLRQAIVIWLTVPMIVCGVVVALITTNLPFTFPAFLGFLSLSGMLIKNCIVMVDEIDKRILDDGFSAQTITTACLSRLRPVLLASGTTIAGMAPLLTDAFFKEMAVAIMGGLAVGTLLTLLAVPVFYRIALGGKIPDQF
jgi:multidrug efflux pump subunit AcrB